MNWELLRCGGCQRELTINDSLTVNEEMATFQDRTLYGTLSIKQHNGLASLYFLMVLTTLLERITNSLTSPSKELASRPQSLS